MQKENKEGTKNDRRKQGKIVFNQKEIEKMKSF